MVLNSFYKRSDFLWVCSFGSHDQMNLWIYCKQSALTSNCDVYVSLSLEKLSYNTYTVQVWFLLVKYKISPQPLSKKIAVLRTWIFTWMFQCYTSFRAWVYLRSSSSHERGLDSQMLDSRQTFIRPPGWLEKNVDACLTCALRDGGASQRDYNTQQGVRSVFLYSRWGFVFGFVGKH